MTDIIEIIETAFESLETAYGAWNAIVLAVVFGLVLLAVYYLIYSRGNAAYQKNTLQVYPFMSGNRIDDPEDARISSDNLYWGFLEVFKGYFDQMDEAHTGNINDYLHWMVVVMAVLFLVIIIGGA